MVIKKNTRLPKTLKWSEYKTIRNRKRKSSNHGDLKRSTWCELFSFLCLLVLDLQHFKVLGSLVFLFTHYISIRPLCRKNLFAHFFVAKFDCTPFCRPESFARKSLLSGKFSIFLPLAETEIHRERGSIAPWKVFARPESFCTEHTFVYYILKLFGKSLKNLESFWIVWKVFRLYWTFLNCLKSFYFVWKFSR